MDEKSNRYEHLPIPTYEQATSSRPTSSQSERDREDGGDNAERQGLLTRSHGNYAPPTVESERSSLDTLDHLDVESDIDVQREMEEMEIEDPNSDQISNRSLLSYRFKRFTSFTNSFQSLSLPSFRRFVPSLSLPSVNWESISSNRVTLIGRLVGITIIALLIYALVATDVITLGNRRMMGRMFDPESVRLYVQQGIQEHGQTAEYLSRITRYPHMAGTEGNYVLAEWVAEEFKAHRLEDVRMERFDVYLNYPRKNGRRVAIVEPDNQRWEANIEEDNEGTYVFHGHSASGDVTGPLIYANFGSREDFRKLKEQGISVQGAIVLVRYYGTQGDRALKVKAAEMAGAAGCIIYSDPAQDGFVKGPTYPDGRFMPEDGVQRGAVSLMSWVVGDVLSPGWASTPGEKKRLQPSESEGLNRIPSIPLSWRDAKHLLASLQGHGNRLSGDWTGVPDTEYWTGDSNSPKVNLKNIQDEELRQPIYNVLGRITGIEEPKFKIIVGNHRDAWCDGAADPGSGTAVMLDIIRQFGELQEQGWRPLRTIEFASWDGEEYNLIGSTEHVESRIDELKSEGIAYLNVDVGVTGTDFHAAASPVFERALHKILDRVQDPSSNDSLGEVWRRENRPLDGLGAGSDYVAFQDIAGVSSIDMSFQGQAYPYHSCYDNFEWMKHYGDPDWQYHKTLAQVLALLILEIADHALIPFDLEAYGRAVSSYIDQLDRDINGLVSIQKKATETRTLELGPLREASAILNSQTGVFNHFDEAWHAFVYSSGGFESSDLTAKRMDRNKRMTRFESNLLDEDGIQNRTQFKHVIFGPQKWSGYDEAYFPGIRDLVDVGDWDAAQRLVQKTSDIIVNAAKSLAF